MIELPRYPKGTQIYMVKNMTMRRKDGKVQYRTTLPKRLMDEVVADKEFPFRVATTILTEKTMWLIVAEGEEDGE
ncbi:MAG: hypothetical protein ACFFER_12005 [Candidatus Thorarchaeota archaeon]